MAKEEQGATWSFFRELFQVSVYKRSQGRIARQVTCIVLWVIIALGAWRVWVLGQNWNNEALRTTVVATMALVGGWMAFRLVNMPNFADFLIAVEAEMNKVSWPTRTELFRSSLVVVLSIFLLTATLLFYDLFWTFLLRAVGVIS